MQRIARDVPDDALFSTSEVGRARCREQTGSWICSRNASRGMYGYGPDKRAVERFTAATWVSFDICASSPWPLDANQFPTTPCRLTLLRMRGSSDPDFRVERVSRSSREVAKGNHSGRDEGGLVRIGG
jgi:hypothetical protein